MAMTTTVEFFGTPAYLGRCIRLAREDRNISTRDLASRCNITKNTILNIELGNTSPRSDIICSIADELELYLPIGRVTDDIAKVIEALEDKATHWCNEHYGVTDDINDAIRLFATSSTDVAINIDAAEIALGSIPTRALLIHMMTRAMQVAHEDII